ncbi:AraC family transcriptional regulator [Curtobacterium sp. 'Ferrero']|uniref:AraC family transcriptional regulator n=1 Tax=Curtobacterium sp. 'Ferrero' TaxID=2033654 RepID=UPI001596750B|nr:helix-turn-helix domain-containing protein [Curtobacterium sp. 'Ferrero']
MSEALLPDRSPEAVRFELAGTEPSAAVRDLGGLYHGDRWIARAGSTGFSYRYTAVGDSDVTVRRSQLRGSIRGPVTPGDDYVVGWLTAGQTQLDVGVEAFEMRPDVPVLFPTDRDFVFSASDYDHRIVHFDRDFVHGIAAGQFDLGDRPLRFDHLAEPAPEGLQSWHVALAGLTRALRGAGPGSEPWRTAKQAAVLVFLEMFPPRTDDLPAVLRLAKNARLRAAVEHIHAHAAEDITVRELSAIAGLSVRSVQESFRRVFDVSPLTYLRQVRLDRVREELLAQDPQVGAVGDVARRWGFTHLGRFSASYAERFGEYPKQTLRR